MKTPGHNFISALGLALLLLAGVGGDIRDARAQQDQGRAGLVVQFADGTTRTYCIPFSGESITGLDVTVEGQGGLGALVCKIGPDGCDYPARPCVCQSYGPNGVYWSYHHLKDGRWRASVLGASSYKVRNRDVEGWAWSSGAPPALYTFEQLCSASQAAPTDTALPSAPTPTPIPPQPTDTRKPLPPPLTSTSTPLPTREVPQSAPSPTRGSQATPTRAVAPAPSTTMSVAQPTDTPAPPLPPTATAQATLTTQPTDIPASTPTLTPIPTEPPTVAPKSTATPITQHPPANTGIQAQTVGLLIAAGTVFGMLLWIILGRLQSSRRGGSPRVE